MCKVIKDVGFFLYLYLNKLVLNKFLKKGIKEFKKNMLFLDFLIENFYEFNRLKNVVFLYMYYIIL